MTSFGSSYKKNRNGLYSAKTDKSAAARNVGQINTSSQAANQQAEIEALMAVKIPESALENAAEEKKSPINDVLVDQQEINLGLLRKDT